jgi:ribonuclease HI
MHISQGLPYGLTNNEAEYAAFVMGLQVRVRVCVCVYVSSDVILHKWVW